MGYLLQRVLGQIASAFVHICLFTWLYVLKTDIYTQMRS